MPKLRVRALIAKHDPWHSSCRRVGEVEEMFEAANSIWSQAGIGFEVEVMEWRFDPAVLEAVVRGAQQRLDDVPRLGEVTGGDPHVITGIYVHSIGGASGKVFRAKKAFVIVDETKVSPSRTTAHEIGHILGLEHWLDSPPPAPPDRPPNQLMARTQVGTELIRRDVEKVLRALPATGLEIVG